MAKSVIVIGDVSSHGNVATSGASRTTVGGIPVCFVGSSVSGDPHDHGPNSIVSPGNAGKVIVGGKQLASVGAGTGCGASMTAPGRKTFFN